MTTANPLTANESCSCGAYMNLMVYSPSELRHLLDSFRAAHRICREKALPGNSVNDPSSK